MHTDSDHSAAKPPTRSRSERFFSGYSWLILRNIIGWLLIMLSLIAGPLIPGPGGIPLFLIGFAMASIPGKRRLTARVMRGRRIRLSHRALLLSLIGVSAVLPALAVWLFADRLDWLAQFRGQGFLAQAVSYLLAACLMFALLCALVPVTNLVLRFMPAIRRRVRPWLRHHHIHLLPPRRRRRMLHEPGHGPMHLREEILKFVRSPRHRQSA